MEGAIWGKGLKSQGGSLSETRPNRLLRHLRNDARLQFPFVEDASLLPQLPVMLDELRSVLLKSPN